jgi:hypothetical protein
MLLRRFSTVEEAVEHMARALDRAVSVRQASPSPRIVRIDRRSMLNLALPAHQRIMEERAARASGDHGALPQDPVVSRSAGDPADQEDRQPELNAYERFERAALRAAGDPGTRFRYLANIEDEARLRRIQAMLGEPNTELACYHGAGMSRVPAAPNFIIFEYADGASEAILIFPGPKSAALSSNDRAFLVVDPGLLDGLGGYFEFLWLSADRLMKDSDLDELVTGD